MEKTLIAVGIAFVALILTRYWLTKIIIKTQRKQQFLREYLDVLNNPEYKTRRT